jgi:endonuclease G
MERPIDVLRRTHPRFRDAVERAREEADASGVAARALETGAGLETMAAEPAAAQLEAIVLATLRPAWMVRDDAIVMEGDFDRADVVTARKGAFEAEIRAVGRVDLMNHPRMGFVGTGWLIDDDIAVTNRHVAEIFARADGLGGFEPLPGSFGDPLEARLDTLRQHQTPQRADRRAEVLQVLYIAGLREPDFAFLRVRPRADVAPLTLGRGVVRPGHPVAAVGYPAWDGGRNDPELMERYFGGVYDVKRFSPGQVTRLIEGDTLVLTDYTSLGGNSGSPVVDLETGAVVGLHFAGAFGEANYAVAADIVAAARSRLRPTVPTAATAAPPPTSGATRADAFDGRNGYDPAFLGDGPLAAPLPALGRWANDAAPVHGGGVELKYQNFSVIQSASRRLPLVTAVNIDAERAFVLKRQGDWKLDGRISADHQIGNELYVRNALDRGHMVRRRDPGWGESRVEAELAERDTFHYTNSAPQHEALNQKTWVGLEDYILQNAHTRGFRACVFTGPVFRETDRRLKSQPGAQDVPIPEEFWKVAVMVNDDTGDLSATGYVLSHGPLIRDLVEAAFVFGAYETYQVRIDRIEQATGLDFGALRPFDPLARPGIEESLFGQAAFAVRGPADIRL